jgi:hypothetical protein
VLIELQYVGAADFGTIIATEASSSMMEKEIVNTYLRLHARDAGDAGDTRLQRSRIVAVNV